NVRHFEDRQARARWAALGCAKAMAAMDARSARDDLAHHLVARILGRIRAPRAIVAGSEDRHDRRTDSGGDMNWATIVGDDQLTAPNERAQRLRAGSRRC